MAQIGNFDASKVAPASAPEAIPAGWYNCMMVESEMKPTQDGTGAYLSCTFEVISGEHTKAKIFDRINLQNKNPVAVEIGYRTLSAICHAVGVMQVNDSALLHNRPLQVRVSLRPAGPGADGKHYDASNEVKGYKAIEGAIPSNVQTAAPVVPPVNPNYQQPQFAPDLAQQQQFAQPQQFAPAPVQQPAEQPQVQQPWAQPQAPQAAAPMPWQQPAAPVQQPQAAPAPQPQAAPWQQPAAPQAEGAPVPPWAQQPAQ